MILVYGKTIRISGEDNQQQEAPDQAAEWTNKNSKTPSKY